jgi:phosphatidylserine/phosphatidylglycerophosphate/cardiolipin synthase-like enzyme
MWTDFLARSGQTVRYRVVPMVGAAGNLRPDLAHASDWTPSIRLGNVASSGFEASFNRGVVASQWLARRLRNLPGNSSSAKLRTVMETIGHPLRNFLAGEARDALLSFVDEARRYPNRRLYAALFELEDPELVKALKGVAGQLHLVLANGAVKKKGQDENADARKTLRAEGADVLDRLIAPNRLGHNKFVVLTDSRGDPMAVLTGSTNWASTGLCTQSNNVLVVRDRTVAAWYRDAWDRLAAAGSETPQTLVAANSKRQSIGLDQGRRVTAWLTPVADRVDLADASRLIDRASQGILFMMFIPGPVGTLLNTILARGDPASPTYDGDLYVHGVLNQNPGTTKNPVVLFHRGEPSRLSYDVVLPAAVTDKDPLRFWVPELRKLDKTHAMVHSKVIVIDPFGTSPVVMTGSHNLGPKASGTNDDNLIIVEGDRRLAEAYAVTLAAIHGQYRWRQRLLQGSRWRGLQDDDDWQDDYFTKPELVAESRFWLGS